MSVKSIFLVDSSRKTKTWWIFLAVLVLVFIPFLMVWLFCGEFNFSGNDWLIAKGASVWHGMVPNEADRIKDLATRYAHYYQGGYDALLAELNNWVGKNASINSSFTLFNPIILAPLFCLLAWSIIYPIVFNTFKWSGLDVIPFSFAIAMFMFILIITGLMGHWGSNLEPVYWLVRLFITFVATILFFLLTNYIVNKYLASRPYAMDLVFGFRKLDKQNELIKQELKENVGAYKKNKEDDPSYIDVPDKEGK